MQKNSFCIWKNIKKSLVAGLTGAIICQLLQLSITVTVLASLISVITGSVFDIGKYLRDITK